MEPDPTPSKALLEEPFSLEEAGFCDDPFTGLDWDEILKPLPTAAEHFYHELEHDLSGLAPADVLRAEEHIEAQELVIQLEKDLADVRIPDIDAPRRKPLPDLPPRPQFPKLR